MDLALRTLRDGPLHGRASLVCMEDHIGCTGGQALFQKLVHDLMSSIAQNRSVAAAITIVALKTSPKLYHNLYKALDNNSINIIDLYSDPLRWFDSSSKSTSDFINQLTSPTSPVPRIIIFDDTSALVDAFGISTISNLLSELSRHSQTSAILAYIHSDLHAEEALAALAYNTTCRVTLQPAPSFTSTSHGILQVMARRRNGRAFFEEKLYRITRQAGEVQVDYDDLHIASSAAAVVASILPDTGTTTATVSTTAAAVSSITHQIAGGMRLDLTEEERAARGNVQLPYEHQGRASGHDTGDFRDYLPPEAGGTANTKKLGTITYIRDSDSEEADSDEDPDDDLDI